MQRRLLQAGFMGPHVVRNYYAVRFFLTLCLPVGFLLLAPLFGASLANQKVIFAALALCLAGLYLPSLWLSRRIANRQRAIARSEEHTSELQSLMRISYAVFCLKKKNFFFILLLFFLFFVS